MICKVEIGVNCYYVVGNHNAIISILKAYKIEYKSIKEVYVPATPPSMLYDIGRLINSLINP